MSWSNINDGIFIKTACACSYLISVIMYGTRSLYEYIN